MQSLTFVGEVHDGQLHIRQPLGEFEGKQVLVTLVASEGDHLQANSVPRASSQAEILEDTGRIRRPACGATTISAQIVAIDRRMLRYVEEG
jgi:hypothetical protein